ncbi:MAG: serine/threonine protein kinase, partial [Planctomycetes bacterium]|nr:serine/threonine protein kinase [Planctomycetota bacterium]
LAMKVLHPRIAAAADLTRRFEREAQAIARLDHPHVVSVIDFGEDKGFLYLIMEFIDGVNLQSFFEALARGGQTIPFDLVAYIAGEILEALRHAHERTLGGHPRGVIHRDIKPSNVLISSEGEVLLTDFGIARTSVLITVAAAVAVGVAVWSPWDELRWILIGAAALLVWLILHNPDFFLRRFAATCVGIAAASAALPDLRV